eukprot:3661028-Rhodomonas_salina.1
MPLQPSNSASQQVIRAPPHHHHHAALPHLRHTSSINQTRQQEVLVSTVPDYQHMQMQQYLQSYNRSLSIASQQQQQQQLQQHPQAFAQPNGQPQAFAQPNGQNPAFSGQRQLAVPSPAMPPAQPQPQPQPLQPTPPNQSSQTPQVLPSRHIRSLLSLLPAPF